jgi:hypothetical protein
LSIQNQLYNLKQLPKTSQIPDLGDDPVNALEKVKQELQKLQDGYEDLIPAGVEFNLLLEKQIALLQLIEGTTKNAVTRFDILEQRAKGINEAFDISANRSIAFAKSIDQVGKSLNINTRSAKTYVTEINKLIPGLGRLDKGNQGYYKNLLRGNEILRERLGLSADEALAVRRLSNLQNTELIPSIGEYINTAKALDDEGITGGFQTFFAEISNTSTDIIAQYSKMLPDALMRTTIDARRLGLTLTDLKNTGDNMLDIQKQTQASYDFQLFTGKALETQEYKNIAAAYNRATLEGDAAEQLKIIESLTKEHGKDLKTNLMAREAAAALLGIDQGKLLEIVNLQQELSDIENEKEASLTKQQKKNLAILNTQRTADIISRKTALEESSAVAGSQAQFDVNAVTAPGGVVDQIIKKSSDFVNETEVGKMVVQALTVAGALNFTGDTLESLKQGLKAADAQTPGKATGGPVAMGKSYMVGELGPELFTPTSAGTITTTSQLASAGGGGSRAIVEALKGMQFNVINNFDGSSILTSIELAEGNRLT